METFKQSHIVRAGIPSTLSPYFTPIEVYLVMERVSELIEEIAVQTDIPIPLFDYSWTREETPDNVYKNTIVVSYKGQDFGHLTYELEPEDRTLFVPNYIFKKGSLDTDIYSVEEEEEDSSVEEFLRNRRKKTTTVEMKQHELVAFISNVKFGSQEPSNLPSRAAALLLETAMVNVGLLPVKYFRHEDKSETTIEIKIDDVTVASFCFKK